MSCAALVDRYLQAITDPATPAAALADLMHPGYTFREWPNAINPAGGERDRAASLRGVAAGHDLLARHRFDVHEHVVSGDTVISRMTWRGTLRTGGELVAHVSQHTTIRDGRIFRTESFDCYEPF